MKYPLIIITLLAVSACAPSAPPDLAGPRQQAVCRDAGIGAEYYDCVERCPGDSYVSQLGHQVCIERFGEAEARAAPRCASQNDCGKGLACVLVDQSTDGSPIVWEEEDESFRCVPGSYGEYRLHTNGMTYLDENGERAVAIA